MLYATDAVLICDGCTLVCAGTDKCKPPPLQYNLYTACGGTLLISRSAAMELMVSACGDRREAKTSERASQSTPECPRRM
eukprot:2858539-Rhodomonas_salina.1